MVNFYEESTEAFDSGDGYDNVDEEEENFSEANYEMASSLETDDFSRMFARLHLRTASHRNVEIKDVIKDNVLPFLPAKSLVRFRSVSKEWDQWIRSPLLALQQSYRFQDLSGYFCQSSDTNPIFITLNKAAYGVPSPSLRFLPELVDIRSSSNGLILCQGCTEYDSYYICNPANQECEELPRPKYYHGSKTASVLVFEPSAANVGAHYELICAVPLHNQPIVGFELYSSETRSWRILEKTCIELGGSSFTGDGFYMKGVAYWETSTREVLAFDLKSGIHEYDIIPLPSESPPGGVLAQIQGELSYISIRSSLGNKCSIEIYGGVQLNLRQTIDIHLEQVPDNIQGYRVLPCVHGNVVMILAGSFVYSYRLSDQILEVMSREAVDSLATTRFLPYVNSLVSVA